MLMSGPLPLDCFAAQAQPSAVMLVAVPGSTGWNYAVELARGLSVGAMDLVLVATRPLDMATRSEARGIVNLIVHAPDAPLAEHPSLELESWLREIEVVSAPDIVHVTDPALTSIAWRAPVVLSFHQAPNDFLDTRNASETILSRCAVVLAPSQAALAVMPGRLRPLSRAVTLGRDSASLVPGTKEPVVMAAGSFHCDTDTLDLIDRVASRLRWPVVVAGPNRAPVGGLGLADANVSLLGGLSPTRLRPWYARASIFTCVERHDAYGFNVLDAALSGCALVLSDLPGLREMWGGAALFVPPNDVDALQAAIETLIADRALREAMGKAARRRALRYGCDALAQACLVAYGEIMSPEGSTAISTGAETVVSSQSISA